MEELPIELLVNIFKYLPHSDLQSCSQVCKRWYDIVRDVSEYAIVLDYNSILDPNKVDEFFEDFTATILDKGRDLNLERLTLIGWSVNDLVSRWNPDWPSFFSNLKELEIAATDSPILMWLV